MQHFLVCFTGVSPVCDVECGLRLGSDEKSVTVGSVGGMVPAVMINNAVLRQVRSTFFSC